MIVNPMPTISHHLRKQRTIFNELSKVKHSDRNLGSAAFAG